ncbi:MAG: hypothetical protein IJV41_09845 [Oscillospiraceae bacterium]|nr:hypothetical protein [Oscillospiraceae bacterium]
MDSINLIPYIEDAQLYDYAVSCARTLRPDGRGDSRGESLSLRRARQETERCHSLIQRRYGDASSLPAACEWLLDNRYMLQREYPAVLRALRECGSQRRCRSRLLVMELCQALLQAGNGKLTKARCDIFLAGFQSVTILQRQELMLFPAALRAVVLEAIAGQCRSLLSAADPDSQTAAMASLFGSLRLIGDMDMESVLERADIPGAILAQDPSGDYPRMDAVTRDVYRQKLQRMAEKAGVEEQTLARQLLTRARQEHRHIGFLLLSPPRPVGGALYIAVIALSTALLSVWIGLHFADGRAALLLLVPVWSLVKGFADFLLLRLCKPRPLPRLDMSEGVPPEGKTLCVISVLLGCCRAEKLEELRLLSRREGQQLSFGLLADLPAASSKTTPADAALLAEARQAVEQLNEKYGGGFYLFTRPRVFDGEGYSAHERKRGALTELAKLLCGEPSALTVTGDEAALRGTRFILTLDADTRVYPGALGMLIGAALHPLNRPVTDSRGVVRAGHAIIHPRMETELESATATDFSLIFAGPGGSDPYGGLSAELYMDAFDCGGFAGKGILDARLLLDVSERLPGGRVLSHDALEGAYLRGAYMGDAAFSDAFPALPLVYYKRQHRWIRGDWQNARWIFAPELSAVDRFRLLDNLRLSLLAPMTLFALLFGFFPTWPRLAVAAWAALLALLQSLLLTLCQHRPRREDRRLRRYTRLLTGLGGSIVRSFMRLWLLPYEAWICLTAIVTALWRLCVSHKRLLQWQTFAQSGGTAALSEHVRAMWPAVVLGVLLTAFSPVVIGKAAGLMWLLSPAAAAALALPAAKEQSLSVRDRDLLYTAVLDSWGYLRELSGPEDHFLPPDNFQQQPPVGAAHRTSPTNIGLALAAAAALGDNGMIERREALEYIRRMTDTLERMERHRGHFYNWYDTRTLSPLPPHYLSTVDCGNLCAGLLATRSALERWGAFPLVDRLTALIDAMDFSPLFDRRRELFYICYDAETERGTGGWYDLMASEAMLTSYLAVARGDVPLKHWRRLSRAQLQKDGYRGLASWTGTMFEYLMPALFLPLYRSSLLYESARFCLYVQKRRRFPGKPWGISESAFYSLDAQMNYRYKAHGCPALALKRGQERDMVISPYSSFLALAVDPNAAAKNLRLLKSMGAYGRWGYLEALDFTPDRCSRPDGEPVPCFMVHHISMSILSALNALEDGSVQRLFLSAPDMAAYTLLLQEKLPDSGAVIRRDTAHVPERPLKLSRTPWHRQGGAEDTAPRAALLSNGVYSLRLKNDGQSMATLGETCVYRAEGGDSGLSLRLDGNPLAVPAAWDFGEEQCVFTYLCGSVRLRVVRQCAQGELGELIALEAEGARQSVPLSLSFRPILARPVDWNSHPAYWKLGLTAELRDGALLLRRLSKSGSADRFLCLACSESVCFDAEAAGGLGALSEPLVQARCNLPLRGGTGTARFALCLGSSAAEALSAAKRLLANEHPAGGGMVAAASARLSLSEKDVDRAMSLVLPLWENRLSCAAARRELWRWGISGDRPILCCRADASESEALLLAFCLLKCCGLDADLVFLSDEEGEYHRPSFRRLSALLAKVGLEALVGSPGGVFFAPLEAADPVRSRSACFVGDPPASLPPLSSALKASVRGKEVPAFGWSGGYFRFTCPPLPPRIWQHVLTNGRLSAAVSEGGPAGLWLHNAREQALIPPPSDIRSTFGPERIYALLDGEAVSLFADGSEKCYVNYLPGVACWKRVIAGREVESMLFIPPGADARLLLIRGAEGLPLVWEADPRAAAISIEEAGAFAALINRDGAWPDTRLLLGASVPGRLETSFSPAAMRMAFTAAQTTVLAAGCCEAHELEALLRPENADALLKETKTNWRALMGRFRLDGGDKPLGHYMNGWALYQTLACRMLARSSLYQCGGAVGFRDQLQDSVNLLLLDPAYTRAQILLCCRHQYAEGDVMHWWHALPEGDKGVRTRCADDLLWLPWALCAYVEATGDTALCRQEESFVFSPPLEEQERDRYETPAPTAAKATVLEHAAAAIDRCVARGFGKHGLPLMGSGDWNDGLDRLGGESLWMGWFLSVCAGRFADLLDRLGDSRGDTCRALAEKVGRAADACFNGRFYPRAWFADGRSAGDKRLDSIAQSWAAFCPWADPAHVDAALSSAMERLVDREHSVVRLLDPPYTAEDSPGYISGYGPGYRENGGQYTHAAVWLARALLHAGRREEGWTLLRMLLPENHDPARYEAEPFVLPADVTAARDREGQAGWTWYTGSAGWYFSVVAQDLLGLRLKDGRLTITPRLPRGFPGCTVHWKAPSGEPHRIVFHGDSVEVDGKPYDGGAI